MGNPIQRPVTRFQDFQVNLETGELWKAGIRLKVQDQPFKVLAALLQRPGEIVTREELRQLIWPEKSFGDFDHAINLAIAKLRATAGRLSRCPPPRQTLPRRGYHFVAPVEGQTAPSPPKVRPPRLTGKTLWLVLGAAAFILLSAVTLLRVLPRLAEHPSPTVEVVPLVSMPGNQDMPAGYQTARPGYLPIFGEHHTPASTPPSLAAKSLSNSPTVLTTPVQLGRPIAGKSLSPVTAIPKIRQVFT